MNHEKYIRLFALTTKDESLYPLRVALRQKLQWLGVDKSVPFEPLQDDEPRELTGSVNHVVAFVEKTLSPKQIAPSETDYDRLVAEAEKRVMLLQRLAATINTDTEAPQEPTVMVFEPEVVEPEVVEPEAVEPEIAEPEVVEPVTESQTPLSVLALDPSVRKRLDDALLTLGDDAPTTVEGLVQFAAVSDPVELPHLGKSSWAKIQKAIDELGI